MAPHSRVRVFCATPLPEDLTATRARAPHVRAIGTSASSTRRTRTCTFLPAFDVYGRPRTSYSPVSSTIRSPTLTCTGRTRSRGGVDRGVSFSGRLRGTNRPAMSAHGLPRTRRLRLGSDRRTRQSQPKENGQVLACPPRRPDPTDSQAAATPIDTHDALLQQLRHRHNERLREALGKGSKRPCSSRLRCSRAIFARWASAV